jgi:hypothetical protein
MKNWIGERDDCATLAWVVFVAAVILRESNPMVTTRRPCDVSKGYDYYSRRLPVFMTAEAPLDERLRLLSENLKWAEEKVDKPLIRTVGKAWSVYLCVVFIMASGAFGASASLNLLRCLGYEVDVERFMILMPVLFFAILPGHILMMMRVGFFDRYWTRWRLMKLTGKFYLYLPLLCFAYTIMASFVGRYLVPFAITMSFSAIMLYFNRSQQAFLEADF